MNNLGNWWTATRQRQRPCFRTDRPGEAPFAGNQARQRARSRFACPAETGRCRNCCRRSDAHSSACPRDGSRPRPAPSRPPLRRQPARPRPKAACPTTGAQGAGTTGRRLRRSRPNHRLQDFLHQASSGRDRFPGRANQPMAQGQSGRDHQDDEHHDRRSPGQKDRSKHPDDRLVSRPGHQVGQPHGVMPAFSQELPSATVRGGPSRRLSVQPRIAGKLPRKADKLSG